MLSKIADTLMMCCAAADLVVAVLYALDGRGWKALYWVAAALINFSVVKMR